jgi:hypothetical protein
MRDMNKMLLLMATIFLAACASAPEESPSSESAKQTRGETATNQPSGLEVKVTKNGAALAAFQSASDNGGVGALLGKDDLAIEITSPDRKWVLSIGVSGTKAGVYRLAPLREAGKAMIILTGGDDDVMMVRAETGELKLSEVSETYCSGSFMGKGTDATGNKYTYEGKFSRIRASRQE